VNCDTEVREVHPDRVTLSTSGEEAFDLSTDLVICTAGMQQTSLVSDLSLSKDSSGRLLTERSLRCKSRSHVFALGDCASIEGDRLPSTAQVAMQQSEIVARNLIICANATRSEQRMSSTSLERFRFVPLGEMLTLGGDFSDASITSLGGLVQLEGPLAALARRVVYSARMPTTPQAVNALVGTGISLVGKALTSVIEKTTESRS